jgi:hypothetical protein
MATLAHVSEGEIYKRASELARKNDKELTFNTMKFFMRFLTMAKKDSESWYVAETSKAMSAAVNMPTRTVSFCLKCLEECGILSGTRGKPTVWRVDISVLGEHERMN